MTQDEIEAELAEIAEARAHAMQSMQAAPSAKTLVPDQSKIEAELAEIAEARKMQSQGGFMHRLGQLGRGIITSVGDEASGIGPEPTLFNPELYEKQVNMLENREPGQSSGELLSDMAGLGQEYEPEKGDTLGNVVNFGGKIIAPTTLLPLGGYVNVAKKAATSGLKGAAKALGKDALMAGAAATAIKATPKMAQEGTAAGAIEDFAKGMFGARAADSLVQKNILKTIARAPKNAFMGAATTGAKPNERALTLAKEHGIELPFNVGMRSRPMNFAANNYLKSMFTSSVYDDAIKNSNESMVNAVKRNIDELGPSTLKPSEASGEYRRFIELEEKTAEKAASELYANAEKFLKKGDSVKPKNTAKFIGNLEELLGRDVQSPATKKVANIVVNLAESWGISPGNKVSLGSQLKKLENDPKFIEAYFSQFKKQLPNVPVEKLIGIRKELGTITNYDPTIKGSESYLNGLKSVIDRDIETMSNKEFLTEWRNANSAFKTDVADRFRGDVARSLLANEMPTEAYSLLNSPQNVREIEKIAGKSPKSKEIFDSLKKAKVREIFSTSLQDESLRVSPFINVFNKKEKNAELLESLIGKPQFKKLSEISEIAEEFKHANQELLNTSGTAIASSDISKAEKLVKGTLGSIFNSGAGYAIGGAGGAAVGIAMPNLISRLVANPKFVDSARAYAIARQNNKKIYSETLLKKIIKLTDTEQRLMMVEARSIGDQKE
jgi:hypothetical protein